MTTNNAASLSIASFQLTDEIATLEAIREAEYGNEDAFRCINIALDLICPGIHSLEEADAAVDALYEIITVTSVRPVGCTYGSDDLVCPWATDLFAIADTLKAPWKELCHGSLSHPEVFGDTDGDELPW